MDKNLVVISLETAKSYADIVKLHSFDEALDVAKSVYETLSKVRKENTSKSLDNYLEQSNSSK